MTVSALFVNAALFQIAWFASVLGAAQGKPGIGPVVALGVVAWHLARARRAAPEALLLAAAVVVGAAFESLLVAAGWLRFDAEAPAAGAAPIWMIALWPAFATTLNVSLRLLHRRIAVASLLGAIAAPIAYYAGSRLGAVEFADPTAALLAIGAGWLVLTPLLVSLAERLDGYAPR